MLFKFQYLRPMVKFRANHLFFVIFTFCSTILLGQVNIRDSIVFSPLIDFTYAYKIPSGDWAKQFGNHSEIGIAFLIKTNSNLLYGADFSYLFGDQVLNTSFADGFRDASGGIIANNGLYSEVYFTERGFTLSAKIGKIFPVIGPNPNSGIMVLGGVGLLQYKIKIEDRFQEVPLLSSDNYYQGYDRLSNGVIFTEFIGYRLLSNRRLINVFGGFEFAQAFTKNRREINFDTGFKDTEQKLDLQVGFKVGFTLPLYKQVANEYYYR